MPRVDLGLHLAAPPTQCAVSPIWRPIGYRTTTTEEIDSCLTFFFKSSCRCFRFFPPLSSSLSLSHSLSFFLYHSDSLMLCFSVCRDLGQRGNHVRNWFVPYSFLVATDIVLSTSCPCAQGVHRDTACFFTTTVTCHLGSASTRQHYLWRPAGT